MRSWLDGQPRPCQTVGADQVVRVARALLSAPLEERRFSPQKGQRGARKGIFYMVPAGAGWCGS